MGDADLEVLAAIVELPGDQNDRSSECCGQ